MTIPPPDAPTPAVPGLFGPDPGLPIRRWVAMLLRLGIGLSLLSSGLAGYRGATAGAGLRPPSPLGGPFSQNPFGALGPFFTAAPYFEIGLGLALVFGFLTTASSIAAGFFTLLAPAVVAVQFATTGATTGGGMFPNNPNFTMLMMLGAGGGSFLPGLLANAALIWLSPLENHPYSVDALIFGRAAPEPFQVPRPADEPASPGAPGAGPPPAIGDA